jgi:hypothetical protein
VKDTIIGIQAKVLEGEWIKSTYGNPGVSIETPEVLRRTDLTKSLQKRIGSY